MRYDEFCANVPPFFSFEGMDVRSRSGEYKEENEDGATGSILSRIPSVEEEEENRRIIGSGSSRRDEIRNLSWQNSNATGVIQYRAGVLINEREMEEMTSRTEITFW